MDATDWHSRPDVIFVDGRLVELDCIALEIRVEAETRLLAMLARDGGRLEEDQVREAAQDFEEWVLALLIEHCKADRRSLLDRLRDIGQPRARPSLEVMTGGESG